LVDTIGLLIPLDAISTRNFQEHQNVVSEVQPNGQVVWTYNKAIVLEPSYSRKIIIFLAGNSLKVVFSLPKFLYGHNTLNLTDWKRGVETFRDFLTTSFPGILIPGIERWQIWRLDICHNYIIPEGYKIDDVLFFLGQLDFARKKKQYYNGTVLYIGTAYTVKFYDKRKEVEKHDLKHCRTQADRDMLLQLSERVLRYEVTARKQYLEHLLLKAPIFLKDITDEILRNIINSTLEKLFLGLSSRETDALSTQDRLVQKYGPTEGYRLYGILELLKFPGKSVIIKNGMKKRKVYYDLRKLREAGISIASIDEKGQDMFTLDFRLPSKLSQTATPAPDSGVRWGGF